ncbi:MAG: hypothetical protein ABI718_11345 [Acidobacteriota bacterium]
MRRKLNFTNRKPIARTRVQIALHRDDGVLAFDAEIDLSGLKLDPDSIVLVEAFYRTSIMRFPWGTVGRPVTPDSRSLHDIDTDRVVHFRIKVVAGDGSGRIVAMADDITVTGGSDGMNEMSLLPVNFVELGELPWRVDFGVSGTTLEINRSIDDVETLVRSDARVAGLLFPAAAREILVRILLVDGYVVDEESEEWWAGWMRWAAAFATFPLPAETDPDGRLLWIDDVLREFCARHEFSKQFNSTVEAGTT